MSRNIDFEGMRYQITWKPIDGDLGRQVGPSFLGIISSGVLASLVGFETCDFFGTGLRTLSVNVTPPQTYSILTA